MFDLASESNEFGTISRSLPRITLSNLCGTYLKELDRQVPEFSDRGECVSYSN